jgi:hypothetical protein
LQADQLLRERWYAIDVIAASTKVHPQVAADSGGPRMMAWRWRGNRAQTNKRSVPGKIRL